jgi:hypothetical protein
MSRTKIIGYLLVLAAVVRIAVDALDGGEFNFSSHWAEFTQALAGAGVVFFRSAIEKLEKKPE